MSTVEQLGDRWPKVLSGLNDAKLSPDDIKAVTAAVNGLTLDQAKIAVPMGFNNDSGDSMRARRHLFRAASVLWYLAYRTDKTLPVVGWQTFQDERSTPDALRKIVQGLAKTALGQNDTPISRVDSLATASVITSQPQLVVRSQFDALKSLQNAMKAVRTQVHTQRQQSITPLQMARKVSSTQSVVSAFQAQGQARQTTAKGLLSQSQEAVARQYFLKLLDIHLYYTDQKLTLLFNFTALTGAVETAYKSFDKDVKKGQEETASKLALAKTFFNALSKAPPPLSFVGSIGGAVVGALHVDAEIDQRAQHVVLQGDENPITDKLKGKFAALAKTFEDKTRVGNALKGIDRAADLQKALHVVSARHFNLIRDTVAEVCTDQFGGTSQERETKFAVFMENVRVKKLGTLTGKLDADRLKLLAMSEADNLYKQTIAAIDSTLQAAKMPLPEQDDLVGALELMLYGSYVLNAFRQEDSTSSNGYTYNFKASLPDTIVNRLASGSTEWAVLQTSTTKQKADGKTRLKWEDRENHKRALCYFFEWFRSTMNPFLMVAGVSLNGKPVTAEYIKTQMMEYITLLNRAIIANAKKESMFSIRTTWNWNEIDYYIGRTKRVDIDELNLQLSGMRAMSNFNALS